MIPASGKVRLGASGVLLFLLCAPGCRSRALAPQEYMAWVRNPRNGLRTEKAIGDYVFTLQYQPVEYTALLNSESLDPGEVRSELEGLRGLQYFSFRISTRDERSDVLKFKLRSPRQYEERVEYFAFGMQKDLRVIEEGDTLECVHEHFERTYGVSPYSDFTLAFQSSGSRTTAGPPGAGGHAADKTFIFDDAILGVGPVRMTIPGRALDRIPGVTI